MEQWKLLIFLTTACIFSQSNALRCYLCSHSKSWEYCEKFRTTQTCLYTGSQQQRCYKLEKHRNYMNNSRDYTFDAGCVYSQYCEVSYMCQKNEKCKLNCCNTNLCNSGNSIKIFYKQYAVVSIMIFLLIKFGL